MFNKNDFLEIKTLIEEFFKKTSFELEVEVLPPKDQTVFVKIKTSEPKILIGKNGQALFDLQRLLKLILKRSLKLEGAYIDVDVNDYKKRKMEYLKELAKSVADEVALTKKERVLEPMPSYERRVIHLELAERGDVTTESIGKEPNRRVVIKPYP